MLTKLFKQLFRRKLLTGISLALIIIGGYFGYQGLAKDDNTTQYMTAAVEKGTLIVSLSGSGQVSASDQVDIKPKVSGDVVYVGAKKGQEVKTGVLLVQIDSRDAQKSVRDAQTSLETAQLELEELLEPVDEYSLMQAESSLIQAQDSLTKLKFTQESKYQDALDEIEKAEDNLEKGYEDGFNTAADAFLDLPAVMSGLEGILLGSDFSDNQWNIDYYANMASYNNQILQYQDKARSDYNMARDSYEQNSQDYIEVSRDSDPATIETLISQTYKTVRDIAEAVKSIKNLIDCYEDTATQQDLRIPSLVSTHQDSLKSYTGTTNKHLSGLLSAQRNIEDNKKSKLTAERDLVEMDQNNPLDLAAAERSVREKEESLLKLKAGADELDIRAKKIAVRQKEDALLSAQQSLADHYIRAPFDGIVANIDAKKGESVSSNAVATLITMRKIAEITLNEIDIVRVKTGQKANITFDAIDSLNITGEVVEVDTLGTATQGVVTYGIKIAFDTQDERVKPGMTLSTAIITEAKQDALLVQSSAIKQQGDISYVELVEGAAAESYAAAANISNAIPASDLKTQSVQTGLSNDTMTEVIDGLKEGDLVVIQTITSNTNQNQTQSSSGFGGSGQMMRIMR